jgi:hypothetical protein
MTFTNNDFTFTQKEIELLFWVKYYSVWIETNEENTASFSKFRWSGAFILNKNKREGHKNKEKQDQFNKKEAWIKEWSEITRKLIKIDNVIEFDDLPAIFNDLHLTDGKKLAFIVDVSSFTPYVDLEENKSTYSGLDFCEKSYLSLLKDLLNIEEKKLIQCRRAYFEGIKFISKNISGSNNTLLWIIGSAAILALLSSGIGGLIGGVMGLKGAAATSAGLAFLGGGSIATGGLGMAGGFTAIMTGGALFGYKTGSVQFQSKVKGLSKEELLVSCAKMIAVLSLIEKPMASIEQLCESARKMQNDFESNADISFLKNDEEAGKNFTQKACILISFRRRIRVMG